MTHDYKKAREAMNLSAKFYNEHITQAELNTIEDALNFAEKSNITSSEVWLSFIGGHRVEGQDKLRDIRNFVAGSSCGETKRYLELCDRLFHIFEAMSKQAQSAVDSARVGR